jgi:Tol biopolymer transport system component
MTVKPFCVLSLPFALAACSTSSESARLDALPETPPPITGAVLRDDLIQPGEKHFAHLYQVTTGVENAAEAYWSFDGERLTLQATVDGTACDRILVTDPRSGKLLPGSNGEGLTTCSYFMPDGRSIVYASTHAFMRDCPPKPDRSLGYVWPVHPEYDIYLRDVGNGTERALTTEWGYDAEATVSPLGDRMVFTSSRSGDLELWTCNLEGGDLKQVTNELGYDGGAFFSHDGKWLVFRSTVFTPGKEAEEQQRYKELLAKWLVVPSKMELMVCRPDGSERRRITQLGRANFAPYFSPDDRRILFSTNHADTDPRGRNFDIYSIGLDGKGLEKIAAHAEFDGFPMFSPDGKWLAFASNRGGRKAHETNVFIAEWRP